jgi:hypothetical protein
LSHGALLARRALEGPRRRAAVKRPRAAATLRFAPSGDGGSSARHVAAMSLCCAMRPHGRDRAAKRHGEPKPSARGAVKPRECEAFALGVARAQRLTLDGEHDDGMRAASSRGRESISVPAPVVAIARFFGHLSATRRSSTGQLCFVTAIRALLPGSYKIASIPLRRITFSSTRAGPVGCFAPRSNFET